MSSTLLDENAIYIFALGLLKGIGPQNHRGLVSYFPSLQEFEDASIQALEKLLRPSLASSIHEQVHRSSTWKNLLVQSQSLLEKHLKLEIVPIPITSSAYSPLLKQISDPPPMLYAKGNISLLQNLNAVAIVGTREPTPKGTNVARHLAHYLARQQFCIVSGLAKGIDAAAHEGALDVHGKTVAVYATPLDTVYPAQNRGLAKRILESDGLVISELPLGQKSFRSAFVLRDRIQSGLSLSVIPVQTAIDGGTMHTVKFAKEQSRLVACPVPLKDEALSRQYEGILSLIKETHSQIYSFRAGKVEESDILTRMQIIKEHLFPFLEQKEILYAKIAENQASYGVMRETTVDGQYLPGEFVAPQSNNPQQQTLETEDLQSRPERQKTIASSDVLKEGHLETELITPAHTVSETTCSQEEENQSSQGLKTTEIAFDNQSELPPSTKAESIKANQLPLVCSDSDAIEETSQKRKKRAMQLPTSITQDGEVTSKSSRSRRKKKSEQGQIEAYAQAFQLPFG